MIKKSSLCNRRIISYINEIHRPEVKALALKKISWAFALKKEFNIPADASDVSLSKALELYALAVMSEIFLIEANDFLMEHCLELIKTTEEMLRSLLHNDITTGVYVELKPTTAEGVLHGKNEGDSIC